MTVDMDIKVDGLVECIIWMKQEIRIINDSIRIRAIKLVFKYHRRLIRDDGRCGIIWVLEESHTSSTPSFLLVLGKSWTV